MTAANTVPIRAKRFGGRPRAGPVPAHGVELNSWPVSPPTGSRSGRPQRRLALLLMVLALVMLGLSDAIAYRLAHPTLVLSFAAAAATLFIIAAGVAIWSVYQMRDQKRRSTGTAMTRILDAMSFAALVTDRDLRPIAANARARDLFTPAEGERWITGDAIPPPLLTAMAAFRPGLTDPDRNTALDRRLAVDGTTWTLSGQVISDDRLLWRIDLAADRARNAVDDSLPVLALGSDGGVSYANETAIAMLGKNPHHIGDVLGDDPPVSGTTRIARTSGGERKVLIVDLSSGAECREIALVPLPPDPTSPQSTPLQSAPPDWDRFETLPVPLLWLTPDGRVIKANRVAVQLIGPGCEVGARLGDLTEGLGRPVSDWLDEALSGHRKNSPEFLRVTASDRETFVQISLKPLTEGGEASLLAVLSDATELKTLEAQFVQSQKMQAIGQLAGGVAHDFNNLLTAISGHCDLLLLRHDNGDLDYADLMQINQNANRAASLVSQLLAFSRKQTLRPEEIDLRETISDLTHLLNRLVGEKVTLSFSHDPVLSAVRADKRQLEQVLMNLVVNARDAIPRGGEIRIVTECVTYAAPHGRDRVTVPPGDYVAVKVIDTGCGIPEDKLTKVFEPFYTTKRVGEGTGLGLSTAYGIIKQSGGYIFAESTVGAGTCFTLLFRAFKNDAAMVAKTVEAAKPSTRHAEGVVLLVEDEAPVRAFASRALRLRGYTVLEAESGEEALEVISDPATQVDIFVTDVVMPGMDGPTWVRKALETRPDVHVVFVSGYAEEHFSDDQAKIPNSVFLPKPFSLSELTQTVQEVVG